MELNYEKQYNKLTKFDRDIMSNLFFQLGTEHNRVYQFEKFKKDFNKNIYNSKKKLNVNYSYDNKSIYRNKILNDASYVFTESNKQRDENDNKLNLRYYLNPSPSQDLFPTQISQPQKLKKNVLKQKEKNENINNKKKDDDEYEYLYEEHDQEYYRPKFNHNQVVYLQGRNNRTYLYKSLKNKMDMDKYTYNVINKLDLTNSIPILFNDDDEKRLDDFALMEKVKQFRKPLFKI
jgi:hypothetical protein